MASRTRLLVALALFFVAGAAPLTGTPTTGAVAASPAEVTGDHAERAAAADLAARGWVWPVDEVQIRRRFEAPAHRYGRGHRGIDLAMRPALRAPADGRIAFAGPVAGRPIVTIDHGDGLVTTFDPATTDLDVGAAVSRGSAVARPAEGGHEPGTVHFGVRLDGDYINPLLLLGGVPRAVLLPCC